MGLSQSALADLCGEPLDVVVEIELGNHKGLPTSTVTAVLEAIGLPPADVATSSRLRKKTSPTALASRMASVSYRGELDPNDLKAALIAATFPVALTAFISAFLDEVPVSLLAWVVDEVNAESGIAQETLWANLTRMALRLKTTRALWHKISQAPQKTKIGASPPAQ
jgi:hypothetical protein